MAITKVSSLDIISSAMESLYNKAIDNKSLKKEAQSSEKNLQDYYQKPTGHIDEVVNPQMEFTQPLEVNVGQKYYSEAIKKLREANERGVETANKALRAFHGLGEKEQPLYLLDPQIGLTQQEAWAIAPPLQNKGFNVVLKTQSYSDNPYKESKLNVKNVKSAQDYTEYDPDKLYSGDESVPQEKSMIDSSENYFSSAQLRLEQSAQKGFQSAKNVLQALKGAAPKTQTINLKDPMLGLNEAEVYALQPYLENLGYKTSALTQWKAKGDELQQAMYESVKGPTPKSYADNPYVDDNEGEEYPRGNFPIGNVTREKETSGPVPEITGPQITSSTKMLDTIEKVANMLDKVGFIKSAKVADELLERFVKEAVDFESDLDGFEKGLSDSDLEDLEDRKFESWLRRRPSSDSDLDDSDLDDSDLDDSDLDDSNLEKAVKLVKAAFDELPPEAGEKELARYFSEEPSGIMRAHDGTIVGAHDGVFAFWAHTLEHAEGVYEVAKDILEGRDPRAWANSKQRD